MSATPERRDVTELIEAAKVILDHLPDDGILLAGGGNAMQIRKDKKRLRDAISELRSRP